jgi:hypothetical protein
METKEIQKKIHELELEEKDTLKEELIQIFKKISLMKENFSNQSLQMLIFSFHSKYPRLFNQETKVISESGNPNPDILFVTNTPNTQYIEKKYYRNINRNEEDTEVNSMKSNEKSFIEEEIGERLGFLPVISYYHYFPNRLSTNLQPGVDDYNLFVYFFIKKIQISKPKVILIASSQIFYNLRRITSLNLINDFKSYFKFNDEYIELSIHGSYKKYKLFQVTHPWVVMKGAENDIKSWDLKLNRSIECLKKKERLNINEVMKNATKSHFESIKKDEKKEKKLEFLDEEEITRRREWEEKKKEIEKKKFSEKKEELVNTGKKVNGTLIDDFFKSGIKDIESKFKDSEIKVSGKRISVDSDVVRIKKNKSKSKSSKGKKKIKDKKNKNDEKKNENKGKGKGKMIKTSSNSQRSILIYSVKKAKYEET